MRRYAAVLLDVDGTLVDSNDAHAEAWVETFAEHDHEVSFARIRRMIGMGGDRLVAEVLGFALGSRRNEQVGARRMELFLERFLPRVRPLTGARALILRLRAEGYEYAIASAAKPTELEPLLQIADIADLCDRRSAAHGVGTSKPDPAAIEAGLGCVTAERSRVVMVGDTPYDLQAARGAGVGMIGVASGGWAHDALSGCVAVYRGPADLLAGWASSPLA